ncbi:MAG: hypothetical protein KA998_00370 [Rickettsiaceae bacterium]|nr:hypothetical protein [Rickettsiaceae bacterium]
MSNVNKLQAPFERLKRYGISPDVSLRKAIIMQAIFDACSQSKDRKAKKAKAEAQSWLLSNSDYFRQICFEADLDPRMVMVIAREEIIASRKRANACKASKEVAEDIYDISIYSL